MITFCEVASTPCIVMRNRISKGSLIQSSPIITELQPLMIVVCDEIRIWVEKKLPWFTILLHIRNKYVTHQLYTKTMHNSTHSEDKQQFSIWRMADQQKERKGVQKGANPKGGRSSGLYKEGKWKEGGIKPGCGAERSRQPGGSHETKQRRIIRYPVRDL